MPPSKQLHKKREDANVRRSEQREQLNELLHIWRNHPTTKHVLKLVADRREQVVEALLTRIAVATTPEHFMEAKGLSGILLGMNELLEMDADALLEGAKELLSDDD